MLAIGLALLSSFTFSLNSILSRRGLAVASASAGAFVTVIIGVPMFAFAALVTGQLFRAGEVSISGFVLLSAAGILHFGLGRYCNYRAVSAIGATRTGPVQSFTIPYAILIAYLFLDEGITIAMAAAIVLVLIGPAVMVERASTPARQPAAVPSGASSSASDAPRAPEEFQPRQAEGYLFALLSVGAYGTSPILIRAALEGETDLAILGGTIAYAAAATALLLTLVVPSRRGLIASMNPNTVRLFLGAGFFVFLAQMFRFMALSLAPVAVITPLQRSGAVFTLILSWTLNRHLEKITWRVVLGIAISVAGSAMLVAVRS
jgi:drug/metabolite transporter (DMT)-like permease